MPPWMNPMTPKSNLLGIANFDFGNDSNEFVRFIGGKANV